MSAPYYLNLCFTIFRMMIFYPEEVLLSHAQIHHDAAAVAEGEWSAKANKMMKVLGAPINEEDAKTIIDYLVTNYGTGN